MNPPEKIFLCVDECYRDNEDVFKVFYWNTASEGEDSKAYVREDIVNEMIRKEVGEAYEECSKTNHRIINAHAPCTLDQLAAAQGVHPMSEAELREKIVGKMPDCPWPVEEKKFCKWCGQGDQNYWPWSKKYPGYHSGCVEQYKSHYGKMPGPVEEQKEQIKVCFWCGKKDAGPWSKDSPRLHQRCFEKIERERGFTPWPDGKNAKENGA